MGKHGYKIRSYVNGKSKKDVEYKNYSLTVPNEIAEALPQGLTFSPRMTKEGLLYVPVTETETTIELPDWAKEEQSGNGKKEK